jgi:hypothetical protein
LRRTCEERLVAGGAIAALSWAATGFGQQAPYRVVDMGVVVPNSLSNATLLDLWYIQKINGPYAGTLGINEHGDVVGTYLTEEGVVRPFVNPRRSIYVGLTAGTRYDLLTLLNADEEDIGYAHAISSSGMIVGGRGGIAETDDCRAHKFQLNTTGSTSVTATALDSTSSVWSWSMALDVESGGSGRIVGLVGEEDCVYWWRAASFGSTPSLLPATQPDDYVDPITFDPEFYVQSLRWYATGVAVSTNPVGQFDFPTDEEEPECAGQAQFEPLLCFPDFIAGAELGSSTLHLRGPASMSYPDERQRTVTRSVSAEEYAAGCAEVEQETIEPPPLCERMPVYWKLGSGAPSVALELPRPSGFNDVLCETVSVAPGECRPRRAVGWVLEFDDELAVIWQETSADDWCVEFLDDLVLPSVFSDSSGYPARHIRQAFDINEHGHIAALADGPDGIHAVLLTHRSDINADAVVDSYDYSILLGDWGCTTSPPSYCKSDVDADGDVDGGDLVIVFNDMFPSQNSGDIDLICEVPGCNATGVPEEESFFGGEQSISGVAYAALAAAGFSSVGEFKVWFDQASSEEKLGLGMVMYSHTVSFTGGE